MRLSWRNDVRSDVYFLVCGSRDTCSDVSRNVNREEPVSDLAIVGVAIVRRGLRRGPPPPLATSEDAFIRSCLFVGDNLLVFCEAPKCTHITHIAANGAV